MFVVVCDFKLFLYDLNSNNDSLSSGSNSYNTSVANQETNGNSVNITPFVSVNTLIDMRYFPFLPHSSALCKSGNAFDFLIALGMSSLM